MIRTRDKASARGLLPRMEARTKKGGKVAYRFHPVGGKPIALGDDKAEAIRKVLDLTRRANDDGTIAELWRAYQLTPQWKRLAERTQADYKEYSKEILRVFGGVPAAAFKPATVARYLRVERAAAPVRANREVALLSNLLNVAVERGDIDVNPCRQVSRNFEQPRTVAPQAEQIRKLAEWLATRAPVVGLAAEFAALAGSRQIEFLSVALPQFGETSVRLKRAKQRGAAVKWEEIGYSPRLADLVARIRAVKRPEGCLTAFPTRTGRPYTRAGFKAQWIKVRAEALKEKIIEQKFTFHDLRAFYVTAHKAEHGTLPELHATPSTTAKVYDRSTEIKRRSV